ncbi:hypothetical protein JAAARDRAFT_69680 [Jaapia argillacea MUCL 33604]|uniref:Uncharacterized protein n=1 Tax=Jaapia argillacea MUCL 33604 TaxID=933084 RepID=A0A067PS71_9AGAM|nr:hypothetical protein JAAARDRAFT_69680 [Jaapia argillacea MUCL 33604]
MPDVPVLRIVPGAPPPTPLSKSHKKKKKVKGGTGLDSPVVVSDSSSAALLETAPKQSDIREGSVASELLAPRDSTEPQSAVSDPAQRSSSPAAELVSKRLKALGKKISRINTYASTDPEKLNEDQRRTLKTLPSLEAVYKELDEVKKAIETQDAEQARDHALRRVEEERAERERLEDALAASQQSHISRTADLLSLIRLQSLFAEGHPSVAALGLIEDENAAIVALSEALLSEERERRHDALTGLLTSEGEFQGVPFSRFLDINHLYQNPAPLSEPEQEEEEPIVVEVVLEQSAGDEEEGGVPDVSVSGVPPYVSTTGSFHFMQDSELEASPLEDASWEQPDVGQLDHGGSTEIVETTVTSIDASGDVVVEESVVVTTQTELPPAATGPIDWANDEGELPSIAGLHAQFGTSPAPAEFQETPHASTLAGGSDVNGSHRIEEEDGFMQARGGRARGRGGFRGERAVPRGGFRGAELRGGFRGGERGFRGGYRGGDRGGDRGGYRGRANGEWRGGRGRPRGDRGSHEPRGGTQE